MQLTFASQHSNFRSPNGLSWQTAMMPCRKMRRFKRFQSSLGLMFFIFHLLRYVKGSEGFQKRGGTERISPSGANMAVSALNFKRSKHHLRQQLHSITFDNLPESPRSLQIFSGSASSWPTAIERKVADFQTSRKRAGSTEYFCISQIDSNPCS
jgi:hypothetical protein